MRIITSCHDLPYAGLPTYTLTLERELLKRGHDVTVYSPRAGAMAKEFKRVITSLKDEPAPDVIIGQHNDCARYLRGAYPEVPMAYHAHSSHMEIEMAPRVPVDWWMAINDQVRRMLVRQYADPRKIDIVRDFIDTERYAPRSVIRDDRPRVLYISNIKKWWWYDVVAEACQRLGLPFRAVGSPYGVCRDIASAINEADLIVSWGRGILEAMACGRAALVWDKGYGDGYLTEEMYYESRERNFSYFECRYSFNVDTMMDELRKYNPSDGPRNRQLVLDHHEVVKGVDLVLAAAAKAIKNVTRA